MRKQLYCDTPTRRIRLAWLSFQPDGAISFGLNDRTYVAPDFCVESMLWNAYNRVGIHYIVPTDPAALRPVRNPHFTYHPALVFQLKDDAAPGKEFLFRGIADVEITLQQEGRMPWIRAVTAPLSQLSLGGRRADLVDVEDIGIKSESEEVSVCISVDFVRLRDTRATTPPGQWDFNWHAVGLSLDVGVCEAQIATLSWFYFY
jgi:hypothetical protein